MSLNQSFISEFSEYYRWSQRTKIKYKLHYESYLVAILRIQIFSWRVSYFYPPFSIIIFFFFFLLFFFSWKENLKNKITVFLCRDAKTEFEN